MNENLEEQMLVAEIEKLQAEKQKIDIERLKVKIDYEVAKKEADKKWWATDKFLQRFVSLFIGITVLGFYITYIVVPVASIKNIQLEIDNTQKAKELYNKGEKIKRDSAYNDSLGDILRLKDRQLIEAEEARYRLDSAYKKLFADQKKTDEVLTQQLNNTKKLYDNYNTKKEEYINKAGFLAAVNVSAYDSKNSAIPDSRNLTLRFSTYTGINTDFVFRQKVAIGIPPGTYDLHLLYGNILIASKHKLQFKPGTSYHIDFRLNKAEESVLVEKSQNQ